MSPAARARFRVVVWLLATLLAIYSLRALTDAGGEDVGNFFDDWIYNGLLCAAAAACLLRGSFFRAERAA